MISNDKVSDVADWDAVVRWESKSRHTKIVGIMEFLEITFIGNL